MSKRPVKRVAATKTMEISAPAKINLFLQVVGRREDGYHELRTLMCCVGLYDTLMLHMPAQRNEIVCRHPDVPSDGTNLALKAALHFNAALSAETQINPQPVSIHLTKMIPVGAGLGGGSSDAAAVLTALNQRYGRPFDRRRLRAMALDLGADAPFFIDRVPALATGVGEKLMAYHGLAPMGVVLIFPGFGISTAEVFKNLNLRLTKCEKQLRYFPFNNGKFSALHHLCNDLEPGVEARFPVIREIKKALLDRGALGALMTGSGSAVYGLFADRETAQNMRQALPCRAGWQIFATELLC